MHREQRHPHTHAHTHTQQQHSHSTTCPPQSPLLSCFTSMTRAPVVASCFCIRGETCGVVMMTIGFVVPVACSEKTIT